MLSSTGCGREVSRTKGCVASTCISLMRSSNENGCDLPSLRFEREAPLLDGMPRTGSAKKEAAAASTERRSIIAGVGGRRFIFKARARQQAQCPRQLQFEV